MSSPSLRQTLTADDIVRLIRGQTDQERATAAQKLCTRINRESLTNQDSKRAESILEFMVADAADLVRRTLAVTLRNSPQLPHAIARRLAEDCESIALPVLRHSPILTEEDLMELARVSSSQKQTAIAERDRVSAPVAGVLSEHGAKEAVMALAANNGADVSEHSFDRVLNRFDGDSDVHAAMISRQHLPIGIAEKLVTQVCTDLFQNLVTKHELPAQLAIEIADGTRERAVVDLIDQIGFSSDPSRFAQQLNLNARLTPSLVMRALCHGHIRFVEYALSELTGLAHGRIWVMLHDKGRRGLETIFERACLPPNLLTGFRLAVTIFHETEMDAEPGGQERFRKCMIERILTRFQAIARPDVDYLLDKLDAFEKVEASALKVSSNPDANLARQRV